MPVRSTRRKILCPVCKGCGQVVNYETNQPWCDVEKIAANKHAPMTWIKRMYLQGRLKPHQCLNCMGAKYVWVNEAMDPNPKDVIKSPPQSFPPSVLLNRARLEALWASQARREAEKARKKRKFPPR